MQVTETLSEGLKRELKVVVPAKELETAVEKRLAELSKTVRVRGFRPGKVPLSVVRQKFRGAVLGEVIERQVQASSAQAIADRNVRPAVPPKVEISSYNAGKDLEFKMDFEILPTIHLGDFSTIELTRLVSEPGETELNDALKRLAESERRYRKVEAARAALSGEQLVIDFKGTMGGVAFEGGAATNFELVLGSGVLIGGFEDQLVGATVGERRTVNVTFPADYPRKELAGKDASFEVTVKELRERESVTIDDELAKRFNHESLEAMRKAVRERLTQDYTDVSRARVKRALLDELAKRYNFQVPASMVDQEFEQIWAQVKADVERTKSTFEVALGKSEAEGKLEYRDIAERRVRLGLLLAEIGRANSVIVDREDLLHAAMQGARNFAQPKQVLDFYRNNPNALERFRAPVFEEKTVDVLLGVAKVTEQAVSPAELLMDPDEVAAAALKS
jgi:trigger factor